MGAKRLPYEVAKRAVDAWVKYGFRRTEAANALNIPAPTFQRHLEKAVLYGIIKSTDTTNIIQREATKDQGRISITADNIKIMIGSDAHYWPGIVTTAHKGFVAECKRQKPDIIIMNGDILDAPSVSRHGSIGWEDNPKVSEEIECCRDRLDEIRNAAPKARRIWPAGNHDLRMESRLAQVAPEYANVQGVHLHDHFPNWEPCWSIWINDDIVIKHRWKGGMYAARNNTLYSGRTIITGHTHQLTLASVTDYNGTRYGVETGTLADPYGPQFKNYTEDNPRNWVSGFVMLTINKNRLLRPQLGHVISPTEYEFLGEVRHV